MGSIYLLKGKVQHYTWGGYSFIPQLLQMANEEQKPFAEYWLGAHSAQPSLIKDGEKIESLDQFINANKLETLGVNTAKDFGRLPFLFKILDVRQMLSIQVHPSKQKGQEGFAKENEKGVPLTAPDRNYKDDNHKPELMVALSDFWLLHGFKPQTELTKTLETIPELQPLSGVFKEKGYEGLYQYVMQPDVSETDTMLQSIRERVMPLYENGSLDKSSPDFWAARAIQTFCKGDQLDKGIFSIYFFNLLHLKKGEGIFQDAGLPHAYLEGQNVEVMANSDNVLRAGLTDKYIDIPELLKLVKFEPTYPNIIKETEDTTTIYESPAAEFELKCINLSNGQQLRTDFSESAIGYVLSGMAHFEAPDKVLTAGTGEAAFICANTSVTITAKEDADIFIVSVPRSKN